MRTAVAVACVLLASTGLSLAQVPPSPAPGALLPGANSKAPISIDANQLEYFSKQQKAIYSGGVIAKQADTTLRASTLTIFFSKGGGAASPFGAAPGAISGAISGAAPDKSNESGVPSTSGNQVQRMEAAGPVSISQKDQVGTGDRGWYEKGENKVTLEGNVTLSQGANVAKGEKLVYDLTTGQAQIVGRVMSLFTPGKGGEDPTAPRTAARPVVKPIVKPKPAPKPKPVARPAQGASAGAPDGAD